MYAVYASRPGGFRGFKNRASIIKKEKKPEVKQEHWGSKSEYILSLIGFAVGIGNIWRFPYLAQKHGGGAFLLAYIIMVVVEGLPLFCLELAIGNHFKKSSSGCMRMIHKTAIGVGWCTIVVCFLCSLYYNSIIMWILRYLFESFVSPLPWATCVSNQTCCLQDRTQYYWYYEHLKITDDIRDMGSFNPTLVVCLIIAWVTIFICIARGIASSGKVVYFSATAPYVVLGILLIRGVTLPGAKDGITYFLYPDPKKMIDLDVWAAAAAQIFYSLGIGFGAIISFASFTKNCDNVIKDSVIITIVNCSTSILGGFVIFSIIGYRRHVTGAEFSQMKNGPGLAFVVIAEAVANMHLSPLWAVLFYSMLLLLGVDSLFGLLESMLHQLREELPFLRRIKKHGVNALVCLMMFLLALPTAMDGGLYVVDIMDNWAVTIPLLCAALGEIVAVMWVYGIHRFTREIHERTGHRIGWYWQVCWMVLSPLVLLVILGASLYTFLSSLSYNRFVGCDEVNADNASWIKPTKLPLSGILLALGLLIVPVSMIPLGFVYGTFLQKPDPVPLTRKQDDADAEGLASIPPLPTSSGPAPLYPDASPAPLYPDAPPAYPVFSAQEGPPPSSTPFYTPQSYPTTFSSPGPDTVTPLKTQSKTTAI